MYPTKVVFLRTHGHVHTVCMYVEWGGGGGGERIGIVIMEQYMGQL